MDYIYFWLIGMAGIGLTAAWTLIPYYYRLTFMCGMLKPLLPDYDAYYPIIEGTNSNWVATWGNESITGKHQKGSRRFAGAREAYMYSRWRAFWYSNVQGDGTWWSYSPEDKAEWLGKIYE